MKKFKNALIRLLLFFLKKDENPYYRDRPKILVATTTALGDTLWGTPGISALRKRFPLASIGVLTSPIGMEVLKNNPDIDDLYLLKEPTFFHFFSLRKRLLEKGYNIALLFHASQRLTLPLLASIGASEIVSTDGKNKGLEALCTKITPDTEHEVTRRERILDAIRCIVRDNALRYFPTSDEMMEAENLLEEMHIDRDELFIIIHPGAKDSYKCWPAQNYIELGNRLKKERPAQILIGWGPGEKELATQIASQIEDALILPEPLPLRIYAALIKLSNLLITNDTGPMHLACALKKPVISIFAPTQPKNCGPLNVPTAITLAKPRTCTPCLRRSCYEPFCLRQISVSEVLSFVNKI